MATSILSKVVADIKTVPLMDLVNYVAFKLGTYSHFKIQKSIYYLQAYHLAQFDTPLIEEDFEAWVHGPIIRKLWEEFRSKGIAAYEDLQYTGTATEAKKIKTMVSSEQLAYIDEMIAELKKVTALQLEAMTHEETPWKNARIGLRPHEAGNNIISKRSIKMYFVKKLQES
jgi:uncharacterized phage-associated protein